jgi:lipopolysaccharide/colanic/teichoic acid biosynthesis glycosyltransferase
VKRTRGRSGVSAGLGGKRAFDVGCAAAGVLVTSPVLLLVAVAVRVESPGPVLFRQERVGRHGATFRIHKFRTMHVDAAGPAVSAQGDPRVTRVGAVLRRTKLDELPQLFDVLSGDMSMVGPRPEVPEYVELWGAEARSAILSLRPGITDPASLTFRHEGDQLARVPDPEAYYVQTLLPKKVMLYLEYVATRSFRRDLAVLLKTLWVVIAPAPLSECEAVVRPVP